MSGLETNKIIAAVLVAGLVSLVTSNVADILYKPNLSAKRGYVVAVSSSPSQESNSSNEVEIKVDIISLLAKASVENGTKLIKKCAVCHDFTKNGPNRVGPNLWSIIENKKAHRSDYSYSNALSNKGGIWGYEDLFHFIHKPFEYLPGTKMNFVGFKKPEDVADVISYLRTLSDNPAALPTK